MRYIPTVSLRIVLLLRVYGLSYFVSQDKLVGKYFICVFFFIFYFALQLVNVVERGEENVFVPIFHNVVTFIFISSDDTWETLK